MSLRLILAASAALSIAAPAFAQEAPATAAPAAAEQVSPEDAALEAAGEVFEARVQAMLIDLNAAAEGAGGDQAKAAADMDAVLALYQPEIDAFIDQFDAFLAAKLETETDPTEREELTTARAEGIPQLRGLGTMIKTSILAAIPAPAPAPASTDDSAPAEEVIVVNNDSRGGPAQRPND